VIPDASMPASRRTFDMLERRPRICEKPRIPRAAHAPLDILGRAHHAERPATASMTMKATLLATSPGGTGRPWAARFFTWRKGERGGLGPVRGTWITSLARRRDGPGAWPRAALGDLCRRGGRLGLIPPGWHGWMHHRVDLPPPRERLRAARTEAAAWRQSRPARPPAYRRQGSTLGRGPARFGTGRRLQALGLGG